MEKEGELRRQIVHGEGPRSQEAQQEEGPSAWISGHIQCLQKERTRSHHPNPEAPGEAASSWKKTGSHRLYPPLSLFQAAQAWGEEGEGLLLAQGGGGSKTGEEKAGSSGSEPEGLRDLTWS